MASRPESAVSFTPIQSRAVQREYQGIWPGEESSTFARGPSCVEARSRPARDRALSGPRGSIHESGWLRTWRT